MRSRFPSRGNVLGNFLADAFATITADPQTWPSGDSIWTIAHAIALAEGANEPGSAPDRYNNPGDLSKGDEHGQNVQGYTILPDKENLIVFASKQDGWQALYEKLANIANGSSRTYSASMTWSEVGQEWAGNSQAWTANVSRELGVSPDSTVQQFLQSAVIMPAPAPFNVPSYQVVNGQLVPVLPGSTNPVPETHPQSPVSLLLTVTGTVIFVRWFLE